MTTTLAPYTSRVEIRCAAALHVVNRMHLDESLTLYPRSARRLHDWLVRGDAVVSVRSIAQHVYGTTHCSVRTRLMGMSPWWGCEVSSAALERAIDAFDACLVGDPYRTLSEPEVVGAAAVLWDPARWVPVNLAAAARRKREAMR